MLLLAASFGDFRAYAADQASLTGTVVDPAGESVPHASITLYGRGSAVTISARSSQEGAFAFSRIAPGEYLVGAHAPGFTLAESVSFMIAAGETKELGLKLALAAVPAQVNVTAANAPQSIDQIAKALDVVDASAIERRGEFSIGQALRLVPGLRVSTRGGPGQLTTIQMRGLRLWDTAILIDGFRLRDATSTQGDAGTFIQDLFTVDSSRIEVLRGAGSSLYGTNAMGGVVNLITDAGGGAMHGDLDLQGGGLGLFRGLARVSGGVAGNRLTYSAGLAHFNMTEGIDGNDTARNWTGQGSAQYAVTPKIRLGARIYSNTGYLQLNSAPVPVLNAESDASGVIPAIPLLSAQLRRANAGLPFETGDATFIQDVNDPDASLDSDFTSALFTLNHQVTPRLSYRIGYQAGTTRRENIDGPLGGPLGMINFQPLLRFSDRFHGRIDTIQARADYLLGSHQILSGGYEFEREHSLNRTIRRPGVRPTGTEVSQQSNAFFLQNQIHLLDGRLQVLLSGRFQNFQLGRPSFVGGKPLRIEERIPSPPNAYAGDAAVSYLLKSSNTKFRSHVGNSYRIPSLDERFNTFFIATHEGTFIPFGDPRLSPERSIGVDAGIDQYLWRQRVRLSGTYFYAHLQQVIAVDLLNPDPLDIRFVNRGGGIARGVEVSGEVRPHRATHFFGSYTYTSALDRQFQFGTGVARSPRILTHTVTLLATQQIGRRLEATVDFLGGSDHLSPPLIPVRQPFRFDGPRQLGLSANYTLPLGEQLNTRLYFRISNTLDQRFYEDGFRNPGRWAVAGLRLSF